MAIYAYSIPAILALVGKIVILFLSRQAKIQNLQTRLFTAAVLFSIILSAGEITILQRPFEGSAYYGGLLYYAASIPTVIFLVHLAILISFDNWRSPRFLAVYLTIYGYALLLEILLLFTTLLVAGVEDFRGYTAMGIPGSLYWLYELFIVLSFLAILFLPLHGLNKRRPASVRSQCKLWIAASSPLALLVIMIIALLHFEVRWFNATVTTPLLITLLLATIGYAVHNRRIIELDFYFPWSKVRKYKTRLYSRLAALGREIPNFESVQNLVDRLAETLQCPVSLVSRKMDFASAGTNNSITAFPRAELRRIDRMVVASEIDDSVPGMQILLKKHRVAAVVPFYPRSALAASWLLLGESFNQSVYTPQDFEAVERLFDKIGGLLIDKMSKMEAQLGKARHRIKALEQRYKEIKEEFENIASCSAIEPDKQKPPDKPLEEYVAEYEARIIAAALSRCNGNKAQAARLLGIRPNTLHYKLKRYELIRTKIPQ